MRNDYGGSIIIDNAGTLISSSTSDTIDATLNGTTNLGAVSIVNSGSVTSNNGRGIYADGNNRGRWMANARPFPSPTPPTA